MLPLLLVREADRLKGRNVIWFVDNTNALFSVVKGNSGCAVLRKLVAQFWILSFRLGAMCWLEYVDSKANWSDGISRRFANDEFVIREGFQVCETEFRTFSHSMSYSELWEDARRFGPQL